MRRAALLVAGLVGCERPPCTPPDYAVSECRVQAENELARGTSVDGVEVRLQDPYGRSTDSWNATGLVVPGPTAGCESHRHPRRLPAHAAPARRRLIDAVVLQLTTSHR
ncbi:MAG: hypothetical protein R3F59_30930 [Myxococcota bacterium]